jgi:hypothetical protein
MLAPTATTTAAPKAEAPVRANAVSPPEPAPTTPVAAVEAVETPRPAIAAPPTPSGLATWRDLESGRIVVQVVDHRTGQVLAQFPPEQILRTYPPAPPGGQDAPQVEVEA